MCKKITLICMFLVCCTLGLQAKVTVHTITSPDTKLELQVITDTKVSLCLLRNGEPILTAPELSLTLDDGRVLGQNTKVSSKSQDSFNESIDSPFYRKSQIQISYNQLRFKFKDGLGIELRLYNQGLAYRFFTTLKEDINIIGESASYLFEKDHTAYVPYVNGPRNRFQTSFENIYTVMPISSFDKKQLAFSPLLVCLDNGVKVTLTEADLESYPGMFLKGISNNGKFGFEGVFAPIPTKTSINPYRCQVCLEESGTILAQTKGSRNYPWRIASVAEKDTELMDNDMVYALASPNRIGSTDWIKPGKVAWDWWNNWGITGVDFPVGINTQTYKYFIDFAAANGIEYVVLDEGWSSPSGGDIMKAIPEIDLKELATYAKEKDVDLILWCVGYVLDKKLEEACRVYSEMGFKGFKVDFMDRDDQTVVEMNYRIAQTAAKYHMLIDFHGMYKPAGMNRTFPNVINFEGIFGLEQSKWSREDMIQHDVTFPYIRMMSGPVDYTQGGMRNAVKRDFVPINNNPMAAGTRAHQVGSYIVFDSPLVMLCDNPTIYMKEQETTDYIVQIPTVWDQTRIIDGTLGEYIVSARKKGDHWYVGALNNWTARDITVDFSFLEEGRTYTARIFQDGVNAARHATDYKIVTKTVTSKDKLTIHLAPGGGLAISL